MTTIAVQKKPVRNNSTGLLVLYLVGFGISLRNAREAYRALFMERNWEFVRTPKYADLEKSDAWESRIYQVPLDRMWYLELAFVILGVGSSAICVIFSNMGPLMFLVPSTSAYGYFLWMMLKQSKPAV